MTEKCPYDPKHVMPSQSLLKHLDSCKSQNRANFVRCKFNQLHAILRTNVSQHEISCPDNKNKGKKNKIDSQWVIQTSSSKIQSFDDQPAMVNDEIKVRKERGKKEEKGQKYEKYWQNNDNDSWGSQEEPFDANMSIISEKKPNRRAHISDNQKQEICIKKQPISKNRGTIEKQDSYKMNMKQGLSISSIAQEKVQSSYTVEQF